MDPREGGGIRVVGMVRGRFCSLRYEDTLDTERETHTGPTATDSGQKLPEMADKRRSQRPGLLKMVLGHLHGRPAVVRGRAVAAGTRPAREGAHGGGQGASVAQTRNRLRGPAAQGAGAVAMCGVRADILRRGVVHGCMGHARDAWAMLLARCSRREAPRGEGRRRLRTLISP